MLLLTLNMNMFNFVIDDSFNDYFIHPKLKISTQMRGNDEKVVEIEIERLHDFKNHPFKVQADSQIHAG